MDVANGNIASGDDTRYSRHRIMLKESTYHFCNSYTSLMVLVPKFCRFRSCMKLHEVAIEGDFFLLSLLPMIWNLHFISSFATRFFSFFYFQNTGQRLCRTQTWTALITCMQGCATRLWYDIWYILQTPFFVACRCLQRIQLCGGLFGSWTSIAY